MDERCSAFWQKQFASRGNGFYGVSHVPVCVPTLKGFLNLHAYQIFRRLNEQRAASHCTHDTGTGTGSTGRLSCQKQACRITQGKALYRRRRKVWILIRSQRSTINLSGREQSAAAAEIAPLRLRAILQLPNSIGRGRTDVRTYSPRLVSCVSPTEKPLKAEATAMLRRAHVQVYSCFQSVAKVICRDTECMQVQQGIMSGSVRHCQVQ